MKVKIIDIAHVALGTALITICAWLTIYSPVPFTLQTFAIFTISALLGWRKGTLSVLVYIVLGIIGVPVFSGFRGGFAVLADKTGGYIIGFLFTAFVVGFFSERFGQKILPMTVSMVVGLALCYTFGTAWFMIVFARTSGPIGVATALGLCVIPYLIPDAAKIAVSVIIANRVGKHIKVTPEKPAKKT